MRPRIYVLIEGESCPNMRGPGVPVRVAMRIARRGRASDRAYARRWLLAIRDEDAVPKPTVDRQRCTADEVKARLERGEVAVERAIFELDAGDRADLLRAIGYRAELTPIRQR